MNLEEKLLRRKLNELNVQSWEIYKVFIEAFDVFPTSVVGNEVTALDFKFVWLGEKSFKTYYKDSYLGICSNFDELYDLYFRNKEEAQNKEEARPSSEILHVICNWLLQMQINSVGKYPHLSIYSDGSGYVSAKFNGESEKIHHFSTIAELLELLNKNN